MKPLMPVSLASWFLCQIHFHVCILSCLGPPQAPCWFRWGSGAFSFSPSLWLSVVFIILVPFLRPSCHPSGQVFKSFLAGACSRPFEGSWQLPAREGLAVSHCWPVVSSALRWLPYFLKTPKWDHSSHPLSLSVSLDTRTQDFPAKSSHINGFKVRVLHPSLSQNERLQLPDRLRGRRAGNHAVFLSFPSALIGQRTAPQPPSLRSLGLSLDRVLLTSQSAAQESAPDTLSPIFFFFLSFVFLHGFLPADITQFVYCFPPY